MTPDAKGAPMPHLKCEPCRSRLYRAGSGDQDGDLCPACGSLLEPVDELAQVVGFRLITSVDATDGTASGPHQRIADRLADMIVRRQAAYAEAQLD
jgi:hypothetical protein